MKKKNSRAARKSKKMKSAEQGSTNLKSAKNAFGGIKEISLDRIVVRAKAQAIGPE